MLKWLTIILAAIGLAVGVYTVATNDPKVSRPPPARPPSVNPFERGIAASGMIEAASRNIEIAPPDAGLVTDVFVQVNDRVTKGQPLFQLDDRLLMAELVGAEAARKLAAANLNVLEAAPRKEDIPPLRAAVDAAKAAVADAEDQHARVTQAIDRNAASPDERARKQFLLDRARANLAAAQAELDRALAGAWKPQLAVSEAAVAQADAEIDALKIRKDRMTVRSPIDGVVLKRNIEPGAYARTSGQAAMVVGDLSTLRVRAQVDEEDTSLLAPGAHAMARLRGAVVAELPLRMLRIEPLASPKMSITGDQRERVDTRVVEVVLEVEDAKGHALYPGQMVDVFIEAHRGDEAAKANAQGNQHATP